MKINSSLLLLSVCVFILGCKKTRTCSCKENITETKLTAPRYNSLTQLTPSPTTANYNSTSQTDRSYDKMKKSEMRRIRNCNSDSKTAVETYTSTVAIKTTSFVFGQTYTVSVNYTADVSSTIVTDRTCTLK